MGNSTAAICLSQLRIDSKGQGVVRESLDVLVQFGEGNPTVMIEYECDDLLEEDLYCQYPETITSSEHFVGTPYYIVDDGLNSALPYMASEDPSLGGFLYLNLYPLNTAEFLNQYQTPGCYEFNYFLSSLLGELLSGGFF